MAYTVRYLQTALNDIAEIQVFNKRFSEKYQTEIIAKIKHACQLLALNPEIHPHYRHNPSFRRIVVDDYQVFYKVDEQAERVSIYRILHGARNIRAILQA
jgi:addiction module RelE/StbE family toxin